MLRIAPNLSIPLDEVEIRASRSSGPGGQHANVTASRIEAVFDIGASRTLSAEQRERLGHRYGKRVTAVAQDARSQARNRDLALERLAERIRTGLERRRPRQATRPGRSARERRLNEKRHRGQKKQQRRRPSMED